MALEDTRLDRLISLINDSFRVRENQDPIYVDVGGHLGRVASAQHQVIFGRRGSGKSCLLVHYHRRVAPANSTLTVYVNADEVKRLNYPDLLIRMLLNIFRGLPKPRRSLWNWLLRRPAEIRAHQIALEALLSEGDVSKITRQTSRGRKVGLKAEASQGPLSAGTERTTEEREEQTAEFTRRKLDYLEQHLQDFKSAIREALSKSGQTQAAIIVDDLYLIEPQFQPDVIDYLHRLLRGTDLYLKLATVRHRTRLARYEAGRLIGIEPTQDVETINLDQTFEDLDSTRAYLARMLDSMGEKVGIESTTTEFVSPEGVFALTLASGGVPRDYLTIFNEAVASAREEPATRRVTPKYVYKGAARISYRTKLSALREDTGPDSAGLERVFTDLLDFVLREKRKTAFLISQDEAQRFEAEHERIQQLMDFKLVHVIVPDTSAASGRPGRYEAYTLDAASFMEPRRRGIELVEFWKVDSQRRPLGIREAPVYPLERVSRALASGTPKITEEVIAELDAEAAGS